MDVRYVLGSRINQASREVRSGSKPEKLNPSRCFLLCLQKLTYLPCTAPMRKSDDLYNGCRPTDALWKLIKAETDSRSETFVAHGFKEPCCDEHCAVCIDLSQRRVTTALARHD